MITVINKHKHHTMSIFTRTAYVGRPSPLGNPYRMMNEADRNGVIEKYEAWLRMKMRSTNPTSTEMARLLTILKDGRGLKLQLECSCAPKACHADIIKKVLEEMLEKEKAHAPS